MPRSVLTPLAAFSVALAWSGGWIAGKLGVASAPPLEFSAIRFIIASGALAFIVVATRTRIRRDALGPVVLSAIFGYLGYNAFVFVGLTMAPASDAALIVPTTIPVLTAIAASFFGERVTTTKVAGFALASIGAALVIAAGQTGGEVSSQRLLGDVLLLVGAVCWSIYTVLGTITLRTRSPIEVVALAAAIGALLLLPFGFLEQGYRDVPTWSAGVWVDVLFLALVVTVGSFTLFYWVVRRVGAGIASMSSYFVPVLTLALAVVLLGDRPEALQLVGGLVILAGVRLATLRLREGQPVPEGAA
ncbi:MAG: DMT family transporter [Chloroflexi bacterium]|nr:MAG: DMT family transporter [Chloroflexota bacterium]